MAEVSVEGLLGLLLAESALNPYAERWGKRTREAQIALEREDWQTLRGIASDTWPDISFSYGQRIVKYHWWGDGTQTLENILSVRKAVFGSPKRDIIEAGIRYGYGWREAEREGYPDVALFAMVHYNAGRIPEPNDPWWTKYAGHVVSYRTALARAKEMLA